MRHIQHNNYLSYIPESWLETEGKGVKVGICDSGCNIKHSYIQDSILEYKVFGSSDYIYHGTHVIGIIVGKDKKGMIYGLANQAKAIVASFSVKSNLGYKNLYEALNWIKGFDIDVLNLSFAYLIDDKDIYKLICEIANNTLVVCAYSPILKYPHSYEEVISVGVNINDKADIITIDNFISSTAFKNNYQCLSGSSMATAFVSSVACLAKSYKSDIKKEEFLSYILGTEKLKIRDMSLIMERQINLVI